MVVILETMLLVLRAANLEQANLLAHVKNFVKNTKPQDPEQKKN